MPLVRVLTSALAFWIAAALTAHAGAPSPTTILSDLGFPLGEQLALDDGAVVTRDLARGRDSELAAVGAVLVAAPLARVEAALFAARRTEWQELPGDARTWNAADFGRGVDRDVAPTDRSAPDRRMNLSAVEWQTLRSGTSPDAAYRDILVDRMQAYATHGLAGVAPYTRGDGGATSPGEELRLAAEQSQNFLAKHFPKLATALMQPPGSAPAGIENRYLWTRADVEGRPAIVLAHEMIDRNGAHCVLSHRQFFVGHTYNSLHGITLLTPARDGTLVVGFKRTFTDRVAGPFNSFERQIGQKMVREALGKELLALRHRAAGP